MIHQSGELLLPNYDPVASLKHQEILFSKANNILQTSISSVTNSFDGLYDYVREQVSVHPDEDAYDVLSRGVRNVVDSSTFRDVVVASVQKLSKGGGRVSALLLGGLLTTAIRVAAFALQPVMNKRQKDGLDAAVKRLEHELRLISDDKGQVFIQQLEYNSGNKTQSITNEPEPPFTEPVNMPFRPSYKLSSKLQPTNTSTLYNDAGTQDYVKQWTHLQQQYGRPQPPVNTQYFIDMANRAGAYATTTGAYTAEYVGQPIVGGLDQPRALITSMVKSGYALLFEESAAYKARRENMLQFYKNEQAHRHSMERQEMRFKKLLNKRLNELDRNTESAAAPATESQPAPPATAQSTDPQLLEVLNNAVRSIVNMMEKFTPQPTTGNDNLERLLREQAEEQRRFWRQFINRPWRTRRIGNPLYNENL